MALKNWIYMMELFVADSGGRVIRFATETFMFPKDADSYWLNPTYLSLDGTSGYANRWIFGRIASYPVVESNLFEPRRSRGGISIDSGEIRLSNSDGKLDRLKAYPCENRLVRLFRINRANYNDFDLIWIGSAESYDLSETTVSIKLRGLQYWLDTPLLTAKYAGTNSGGVGLEGTVDDLKDKTKPFCMGKVFNVPPAQVNSGKLIYQVEGQQGLNTGYALTVKDQDIALTYGGTYANTTDLQNNALAPAAGAYKVYPAGGYFRLGASPVGAVTCNVTNPANLYSPPGVVWTPSTYVEAQWLLIQLLARFANNELTALNNGISGMYFSNTGAFTYPSSSDAGVYYGAGEEPSYLDVLSLLQASCGCGTVFWVAEVPSNNIFVDFVQITSSIGPNTFTLAQADIRKGTFQLVASDDPERGLLKTMTLNYRKNYQPMARTDAPGVTEAELAIISQEWRNVTGTVTTPLNSTAKTTVDTALYDEASATSLFNDVLEPNYVRGVFPAELEVEADLFDNLINIGPRSVFQFVASTTDYPRYGVAGSSWHLLGYARQQDRSFVKLTLMPINAYDSVEPLEQ